MNYVGVALRFKINAKLFDLSWSHNYMKALIQELVFASVMTGNDDLMNRYVRSIQPRPISAPPFFLKHGRAPRAQRTRRTG